MPRFSAERVPNSQLDLGRGLGERYRVFDSQLSHEVAVLSVTQAYLERTLRALEREWAES